MSNQSQLKKLITLQKSEGWEIVNSVMKDEILQLALLISRSKQMSQQEVDFNRGAIWAAEQMLNLPTKIVHKLEGEIALEDNGIGQG